MSPALSKVDRERAVANALARLGAARRERLTPEDLTVYADGLRPYALEAVVTVCRTLEQQTPAEYGPRYPALGDIVQGVKDYLKREQVRREQNTLKLPEGRPVDPPTVDEFRRRVEAFARGRGFDRKQSV